MYLPINGRVAIIDNEINEVMPLFKIFSQNRIPYLFINGNESEWLPIENNSNENDIRLLFLDLNLTGNRTAPEKEVKSIIYGLLRRIISPSNFPYSIVLWSKQEDEYAKLVYEIFDEDLVDRKPITIKRFVKSDYFELDGSEKQVPDRNLINDIKQLFEENQAYSTLVYWENKVHRSADSVLQTIFTSYENDTWTEKSNFVIDKLGEAYLGFKTHKESTYVNQIKGALQAFNSLFNDTLEYNINVCSNLHEQDKLKYDESKFDKGILLDTINHKLLISKSDIDLEHIDYTGTVTLDENPKSNKVFESLFNESFDRSKVSIPQIADFDALDAAKKNKEIDKMASQKRKEIRKNWQKIYLVVTPLCDKVQNKQRNIRVVKGFVIDKQYKEFIDEKSEALYISPSFYDKELKTSRIIILNFRYFFTFNGNITNIKSLRPSFRLRNDIMSEIQSKIARHVSRQGILYVE